MFSRRLFAGTIFAPRLFPQSGGIVPIVYATVLRGVRVLQTRPHVRIRGKR